MALKQLKAEGWKGRGAEGGAQRAGAGFCPTDPDPELQQHVLHGCTGPLTPMGYQLASANSDF